MENGKILEFLQKQRTEDKDIEEKRHTEVLEQIKENRKAVMQKIETHSFENDIEFKRHAKYHKDNEPKWGVWTLFKRKPVLPILFGIIVSGGVFAAGYNLKDILKLLIDFAK